MRVYDVLDYKSFLNEKILAHRREKGYKSKIAKAAGFTPSFLSQILHGHSDITADQAFKLACFWSLSDAETDYFLLLVDHARACTPALRHRISAKMRALRSQRSKEPDLISSFG